jgi:tungstate transport system substrate-binding protein
MTAGSRTVMRDNFIIVGPSNDPAHVRDTATAVDVFKHFAAAGALFVSRADDSGTNIKELELWQTAGITAQGAWYIKSGSGMGDTLHIASKGSPHTNG